MTSDPENKDGAANPGQRLTPLQRRRRKAMETQQAKSGSSDQPGHDVRVIEVAPAAQPAFMHARHWVVILSFIVMIILPTVSAGVYLYGYAADQYASRVGFTVRREEGSSAFEILGGLSELSANSSSDTDILYEYIRSQELVKGVDSKLDLLGIFSRPEWDPVFTIDPEAPIEELMRYWRRMVRVYYAPSTGLIEVEVRAFQAEDAQLITKELFEMSSEMINRLSAVAAEDTTRYAQEELDEAARRLKEARIALTRFRNETQIVDPSADIQGQMGLLNNLHAQLASALIELDLLAESARENDPRVETAKRKILVIQSRIAEERRKLGVGGNVQDGTAFADLVGQYESLQVDREFAEKTYLSALSAYDSSVAEARRQSRYLAAYVQPTLAESAEYPKRAIILAVIATVLFGIWCLVVLIGYSLKDRR